MLLDASDQELHADQRLAGTGAAADQRGPPARKTAAGDNIQAVDAGGALWKLAKCWRYSSDVAIHGGFPVLGLSNGGVVTASSLGPLAYFEIHAQSWLIFLSPSVRDSCPSPRAKHVNEWLTPVVMPIWTVSIITHRRNHI